VRERLGPGDGNHHESRRTRDGNGRAIQEMR